MKRPHLEAAQTIFMSLLTEKNRGAIITTPSLIITYAFKTWETKDIDESGEYPTITTYKKITCTALNRDTNELLCDDNMEQTADANEFIMSVERNLEASGGNYCLF